MNRLRVQAIWLFSASCFAALLQVIQLAVLARRLDSYQLGVMALVNAILALASVLQDIGMGGYLVHRQTLSAREQSTLYWINVVCSLLMGLGLIILAWPIAWFYQIDDLAGLVALTSLNFLLLGHLSQYQAHYVKEQRMVALAKIEIVSKLLAFVATLAMLYLTRLQVSALILGLFINALSRLLLMVCFGERHWRPGWQFDRHTAVDALRYGVFQLGSQSVIQLRTQADSLIVGKLLGADTVGVYSLVRELVLQPLKLLLPVMNRLLLPLFARHQQQRDQMQWLFLRSTFVISLVSSGLYLAIGLFSPLIARILYGSAHQQVYQLVPLMLLFAMLRPISGLTGIIAQANGLTHLDFYWNLIASLVMISLLSSLWFYPDIRYVALMLSLSQLLLSVIVHPVFIRPVTGITFLRYARQWLLVTLLFILLVFVIDHNQLYLLPAWFFHPDT